MQINMINIFTGKRFTGTTIFTPLPSMFELFDLEKDPGAFTYLAGKEEYREVENMLNFFRCSFNYFVFWLLYS